MMRGAWRTSLLVVFCLLTSTATAYAECAWVLWDGQISPVPGRDMSWTIDGTYATAKACKVDLANYVAGMRRSGSKVTDPRSGTSSYKSGETRGYLHCLP